MFYPISSHVKWLPFGKFKRVGIQHNPNCKTTAIGVNSLNKMIEYITNKDILLSIIIRTAFNKDGIEFFTPDDLSQQLAYMKRPKNHVIKPHAHNPVPREVVQTNEVLFIRSGKIRVDFYDQKKSYLKSSVLEQGDVILLASGGHGIIMLEETEIIEVKQGPYLQDKDKTRFDGIKKDKIKLD